MVSNVGSAAISAVSLVDSINILVIQALSALAAGGAILCSQYLGSHNTKGARHAARQVFFVMAFLSVLLSAFCLITRKALLRAIFGAVEADVMRNSQVYFFFTLLSFPFIGLYDAGASIMRAQNNSRNPMVISVISNFMNIGGNAIFDVPGALPRWSAGWPVKVRRRLHRCAEAPAGRSPPRWRGRGAGSLGSSAAPGCTP